MLLEAVLTGAVRGGTSILYAAVGETVTERSGVINLGRRGLDAVRGAGRLRGRHRHREPVDRRASPACAAGAALAAVHAGMVLGRHANQIATGLVVTFLGIGHHRPVRPVLRRARASSASRPGRSPGCTRSPFFGPILFDHDPLTYLSFVVGPLAWWFLFRTRSGLLVRTAGERAEVLHTFGTSPTKVRFSAVVAGGALAGLGGAQLSTAQALNWSENMTVGRGFVAVALVIFAAWNPLKAIGGAYLFSGRRRPRAAAAGPGLAPSRRSCSTRCRTSLVIVVLAALGRRRRHAAPEELDQVFETSS